MVLTVPTCFPMQLVPTNFLDIRMGSQFSIMLRNVLSVVPSVKGSKPALNSWISLRQEENRRSHGGTGGVTFGCLRRIHLDLIMTTYQNFSQHFDQAQHGLQPLEGRITVPLACIQSVSMTRLSRERMTEIKYAIHPLIHRTPQSRGSDTGSSMAQNRSKPPK